MEMTLRHREIPPRARLGTIVATALAVGGIATSVFAVSTAGAATKNTTTSIVVSTAKTTKLGTFLVSGKTLYTLKASKTACTSACLKVWPELVLPKGVTKVTAGKGVSASKLGTIMRANGAHQVTYNGKPLYWFSGDKAAGQVHGNVTDTWGTWSTLTTVKPKSSSSSSSSGGTNTGTGGVAF